MFDQFEKGREICNGVEINYVIGGSGPPVLLLHGFPQNLMMWGQVAPILAENFTIVAADLRGYGGSGKPKSLPDASNYSFRAMARDQVELMQTLGFDRFHLVGHDRGGRTGHRMALDFPEQVMSLAVLDIAPTHAMFTKTNRHIAGAYWHWYFLSTPEPFAQKVIAGNPDVFFETCLTGWGATVLEDFNPEMLAEYRNSWRDLDTIHGFCADYRAAASIDLALDDADINTKLGCPTLAFWGSAGVMHTLFDMKAEWAARCEKLETATLPGGHFFVDQFPQETAKILKEHLKSLE